MPRIGNTTNPPMTRVGQAGSGAIGSTGMGTFQVREGSKPVFGPHKLTEDYKDNRDPAKKARLLEESIGLKNLASNKALAERARYVIREGISQSKSVREQFAQKWLTLYRLYKGEPLQTETYGRIPLHSPEPFKVVETIHPRMMRILFGSDKWFKLYGEEEGHDGNAMAQEALCRDQLRAANFVDKASRHIRDGLIYGTAAQKLWWKQEVKHMRYRLPVRKPNPKVPGGSIVELKDVSEEELVYDGNYCDNISVFDLLAPPNASGTDDAEWMADRSLWPDYAVKEMGEMGHWLNLEALEDTPGSDDQTFGDEYKERKSHVYGIPDPREGSSAPHVPHYTVIDWWGYLRIEEKGKGYKTRLCNVVMLQPDGLQIIARITEMPFWHQQMPYQVWNPINLEDEFFGVGAIEMIARLSMEKDMKRNLGMAAAQLEGNPAFALADDANVADGQLVLTPGFVLRVPDPTKSIVPIHVPKTSDSAYKAEALLTSDIRETAGTTSPSMGAQDPMGGGGKTATQHTAELDMTSLRISNLIGNYEHQVIERMLFQMTWNNQQFQSYAKTVRDIGPIGINFRDRYTVNPEDLIGRFICKPLASFNLLTKHTQVQQLVNILDRGPVINQMYGPNTINLPKLMIYILEHGFDVRNADDFVNVPEDISGLLTPLEEHEYWYHGNVPPRKSDDNDLRHVLSHLEEIKEERFAQLDSSDPQTGAKVRAHIAEHIRKIALTQDRQEYRLMQFAQVAAESGIQIPPGMDGINMQGSNIPGAAGPNQEPGSPKVRRNENQRGEGSTSPTPGSEQKSEAGIAAPNLGAQ